MAKKTENAVVRQSSRKRKVPDRFDEYVSSRAAPDSPEPRSRSNSPVSRKKASKKKKEESESEDEVPSEDSDVEEESEVEQSEEDESNPSDSEDDHKKKKSRGRSASKSKKSSSKTAKSSKSSSKNGSKKGSKKSFMDKLDDDVKDELEGYGVEQLKDRLRDNDQITTGTKGELQERVAECIVDGSYPRCPKCALGKVKKDSNGYFCPGGYDDDKFKRCSWKAKAVDRPKWKVSQGNLV